MLTAVRRTLCPNCLLEDGPLLLEPVTTPTLPTIVWQRIPRDISFQIEA